MAKNLRLTLGGQPAGGIVAPAGFAKFYETQYASNDGNWNVYDNDTFGAPTRIQRYMAYNAMFGSTPTAGATLGTSMRLQTQRELVGGNDFTAGMVDTKGANFYFPRYMYLEQRGKIPHGQGLWTSWWITARIGGATCAEFDYVEYFHSQVPGKNSSTLHGQNNAGVFSANRYTNNVGGRTFFEAPTYTPGWHKWAVEILPVTDATGTVLADLTQPSSFVRFRVFLDGVEVYKFVDTSALYWTTNGGTEDSFWNNYIQGCQINGNFVGHPDDALGYSRNTGNCLISGTPPGSCATASGGYNIFRAGAPGSTATFLNNNNDPATTVEIDYTYVAKAV